MEIRNAQCTLNILGVNNAVSFTSGGVSYSIPLDPANRHYQEVLDAIIAEGAACFYGDIPAELQAAADAKLASGAYNGNKL